MAGDYLPVRSGLHREPEVLAMADATGRSVFEVVGLCVAFWDWIQSVSVNGRILSANVRTLCAVVGGDDAFWSAMASVKWLDTTAGITMPKFDSWLSHGAKRRLKDARRKKLARENLSAKRPQSRGQNADKMRTRGEERREEDDDTPLPPTGGERIDWESIKDRWNSDLAPRLMVSRIEGLTDERKRKVQARLREHPDMLDRITAEIPHLSSWAREKRFFSFDWFLSPKNLQKWIEGSYRQKEEVVRGVESKKADDSDVEEWFRREFAGKRPGRNDPAPQVPCGQPGDLPERDGRKDREGGTPGPDGDLPL